MEYSIAPLTNSANVHVGFVFMLILITLFMYGIFSQAKESHWSMGSSIFTMVLIGIGFLSHNISFAPENNIPMKNEKVTAKFIDYVAEQEKHSCGKSTCYTSLVYGRFETPDGAVLLKVENSNPIPQYVTLYKN